MPYHSVNDLPPAVRDRLPFHAREIFRAAFNDAWEQNEREPDRERTAFRIAWAAVKRRYRKVGDEWVERIE